VIFKSMGDQAPGNLLAAEQFRSRVHPLPTKVNYDAEWCSLHGQNGAKVQAPAVVRMTGKLFTLASLFRTSAYNHPAMRRLIAWLQQFARRIPSARPDPERMRRNREIFDAVYELDSEDHYRTLASGERVKGTVLQDLETMLELDNNDVTSLDELVHYCYDPATGGPCCVDSEEMVAKLAIAFGAFYLGRQWELPAVSRFTNTGKVSRRVMLLYAHHGLLRIFVEFYEYEEGAVPSMLELGAISDFQVVHRVRKHDAFAS